MRQLRSKRSDWTWLPIGVATGIVVAIGAALVPALDAVVIPFVAGLLLLLMVCHAVRPDDRRSAQRIVAVTLAAFAAHMLIGVVINQSAALVRSFGGDATTYNDGARMIVAHWHHASTPLPHMAAGKEGFYYALGALYWVFGPYPMAGLALNAFFAAALVPLLFDVTTTLFGSKSGWWAIGIVTLEPGFLVWTSQLLREAGILFFLVVALSCAIRLGAKASFASAFVLTVDFGLLLTFRADVALIVAVGLAVGLTLSRRQVIGGLLIAVTVVIMGVVLVVAVGLGRSGYKSSTSQTLAQVSLARGDLASSASSGFDRNVDVSTPGRALSYLPRGLPSFLWGPFPWQLRNVLQLLGGLEALTVVGLTPAIWRGWRTARARIGRKRLLLVLPAAALATALALLIGNYGTVVRERLQVLVFVIPLAAVGISERQARRATERAQSGTATVGVRPPIAPRRDLERIGPVDG